MVMTISTSQQQMVEVMQKNLRAIRILTGLNTLDFSMYIGLTRQSLNNLESGRTKMHVTQFLAICALIEEAIDQSRSLSGFSPMAVSIDAYFDEEIASGNFSPADDRITLLERYFDLCQ